MKKLAARVLGILFAFTFSFLLVATTGPLLTSSLDSRGSHRVSAAATLPAPVLVSPANGEAAAGPSVAFQWEVVSEAVDYRLIVSTGTNPLDTAKRKISILVGNMTTYTDTGYLGNGTKYYWWVWAYDADGNQSAWTAVSANRRWFTNPPITVGAPALTSPANDEVVAGSSVAYQWEAVSGGVDYRIIVSTGTNPLDTTKRKINILVGNVTNYEDTGYPALGAKYYWWVWAYNDTGKQSAWSEVSANGRWFINSPIEIDAPALTSPENDEVVAGGTVAYQWEAVSGAAYYRIIVSTGTNPLDTTKRKINILVGNVTNYQDTGYPALGAKYYWWVWAYNDTGRRSAWSDVSANGRWFITSASYVEAPVLVSPQGESTGGIVNFSWDAVEGAVDYQIIVSTSTNPLDTTTRKISTLVGDVTGYEDTGYVADGTTKYYWWVWAFNAEGNQSGWSEVSANGLWFRLHECGFYQWNASIPNYNPDAVIHEGTIDYSNLDFTDFVGVSSTQPAVEFYADWGGSSSGAWDDIHSATDRFIGDGNTNGDFLDGKVIVLGLNATLTDTACMQGWWDLGRETDRVVVFGGIDHAELFNHPLHFRLYGSNTLWSDELGPLATVTEIYVDGWRDNELEGDVDKNLDCWYVDDVTAVFSLGGQYRYVKMVPWDVLGHLRDPEIDALAIFPPEAIDLEKLVNGEDADSPAGPEVVVGSTVTFDFVVTNTGIVDLTNVVVTDSVLGLIGSIPTLAVGASQTLTVTAVAEAGQHANMGSVTTDEGASDTDAGHYYGGLAPAIDLEKLVNGEDADSATGPAVPVGSTVTFEFVVTNTGSVDLTNVVVTDSVLGYIGTIPTLAVGASQTLTATAAAEAGQYTNTGSVTTDQGVSDTDAGYYYGVVAPAIDLEKLVNGEDADSATGPEVPVGSTVTFEFVVTNTGNVELTNAVVTDSVLGYIGTIPTLAVGASQTLTATAAAEAGQYTNTGSVTTDQGVSDTDAGYYFGVVAPAIDLEKLVNGEDADSATGPVVLVGSTVTFEFVVTNTGSVELTNVVVTDSVLGYIGTIPTLAVGASQTLTVTAVAAEGQHANTGSVTTDQGVSDTDPGYYFGADLVPPIPELPAVVLLGVGLVAVAGLMGLSLLRRRSHT